MRPVCMICSGLVTHRTIFSSVPVSSAHLNSTGDSADSVEFGAVLCPKCGHITNETARLEGLYASGDYVLKTAISERMSLNLQTVADAVVDGLTVEGLRVLEIGSGSGELARWLSDRGALVYTVDPSVKGYNNDSITHQSVNFDGLFVAGQGELGYDLIIARHVLEHTGDPAEFVGLVAKLMHENTRFYVEVPNLRATLKSHRLVDFFNDHVQHFSDNSLGLLLRKSGLKVTGRLSLLQDQHFGLMTELGAQEHENQPLGFDINQFLDHGLAKLERVIAQMEQCRGEIIIYGAGAHAVTFVSQLSEAAKAKITAVWDKDLRKKGRYIPGLKVPISQPGDIPRRLQMVVNTGALYAGEIELYLVNELKFMGTIIHL